MKGLFDRREVCAILGLCRGERHLKIMSKRYGVSVRRMRELLALYEGSNPPVAPIPPGSRGPEPLRLGKDFGLEGEWADLAINRSGYLLLVKYGMPSPAKLLVWLREAEKVEQQRRLCQAAGMIVLRKAARGETKPTRYRRQRKLWSRPRILADLDVPGGWELNFENWRNGDARKAAAAAETEGASGRPQGRSSWVWLRRRRAARSGGSVI